MTDAEKIRAYIKDHLEWKNALLKLRNIMLESGAVETVKWGVPVYTVDGKNLAGIAAFKKYVGLWFYQGVFLKDSHNKLVNASENKTKALRQLRFSSADEMDEELVASYMAEAIANHKAGKELKPEKKKVSMPEELKIALKNDLTLREQFDGLTPYKQTEYAEHIGEAKREETRVNRLKKSIPIILEGKGLHDKYRNC